MGPRRAPRETEYDGWMLRDEHTGQLLEDTLRRTREACRQTRPRTPGRLLVPVKVRRGWQVVER